MKAYFTGVRCGAPSVASSPTKQVCSAVKPPRRFPGFFIFGVGGWQLVLREGMSSVHDRELYSPIAEAQGAHECQSNGSGFLGGTPVE